MKDFFLMRQWGWKTSGTALGLIIVLAVVLVKPIGISTQYVIFDGILWNTVNSEITQADTSAKHGYKSTNQYLNKSGGKYAKAIAEPINYGVVFILSMIFGGFLASKLRASRDRKNQSIELLTQQQRFGTSIVKRYSAAFIGGLLVLFGARLAGGCTSGHMMSGMMQTSYSAYVFTLGVFAVAIPTALLLYRRSASDDY